MSALKSKLSQSSVGGFPLRRVLVVTQFSITQILIICMLVIAGQIQFSANANLGFTKDAIVLLPLPQPDPVKMHTLLSRISSVSGTQSATLCSQGPASGHNSLTSPRYDNRPKDEPWEINYKLADDHYIQTFGIHLLAGRNLFPSDTAREFLVNETFVHRLGLSSPQDVIGQPLAISGNTINGTIVGVVKDFYNNSFRHGIDPVCITSITNRYGNCAIKVNLADWNTTQPVFAKIWNETYPDYVYSFQFLDERIARFYAQDRNLLQLVEGFACIAILIGCMGLYGLVSFMAAQKTKEIGVRKVLGAGTFQIFWLFGREFSLLLGMAFAIGAPLAAWAMSRYLRDYTYHIQIGWGIFALAIAATCFIAALTVAGRSIKAVRANPIKSLRTE